MKAYDGHGGSSRLTTGTHDGTQHPRWNQWLDFGTRDWIRFTVKVWDNDGFLTGRDDALSGEVTYYLHTHTTRYVTMNANRGFIVFSYYFQ